MRRNSCPDPNPSCGLRTLEVRNRATTGVASATATATTAQPKADNHLLAKEIREVREKWAAQQTAQLASVEGAIFEPISEGPSCAPKDDDHHHLVVIESWRPSTPSELAEERRRVLEEEPRCWWWEPRYGLAVLERDGMDRVGGEAQVRAEYEAAP